VWCKRCLPIVCMFPAVRVGKSRWVGLWYASGRAVWWREWGGSVLGLFIIFSY
jgi:hypothetical protein